jgi:hypothetical protein
MGTQHHNSSGEGSDHPRTTTGHGFVAALAHDFAFKQAGDQSKVIQQNRRCCFFVPMAGLAWREPMCNMALLFHQQGRSKWDCSTTQRQAATSPSPSWSHWGRFLSES